MTHPWDRRLGFWWIAEDHPDQVAVIDAPSGSPTTYGELAARAHQLVHALRSRGFEPGDIIAYALPNDIDPLVWQLAIQESGLFYIMLNPALSGAEIRSVVEHSGAAGIVVHQRYGDRSEDLTDVGTIRLRVSVGGPLRGYERYEDLVDGFPTAPPDDRSLGGPIVYSSGTTGKPKAIERPLPKDVDPGAFADRAKIFGQAFQFLPLEGVHLVSAGMHHGGCQAYYVGALNVGQSLVIMGKFDPEQTLELIERYRVTTAYMVPTQFVRLLRLTADVRARYDVASLQVVVHSAAPCPADVKQQMLDWWGPVIWETYGGMEGAATIAKPYRWIEKPGTVGRAVRGMTIKILDDDGNLLAANEIGHVYLEPEEKTFEYRNDPELTASISRGKAFTLGDMGYLDEDGYLFIRDRAKDMVVSGGVNIYPAEIEAVLHAHTAVADVAVIGVPDAEWGESVKAVVEVTPGSTPGDELADELIAWCRGRLASYKCPRTVDFRQDLPRTDSGKLLKRNLRDEYWAASDRNV